ncbi:SigE family RNA polymerase sigma factor [Nocardioides agariphilus]|uniref:SigE family RNA polymerase sigma factor n=1 Tax=Nocardioides agariphilus TaxID=433664 RepID=A0A930VLF5_9ACTN|nr:SigE family RNA polymerase sigma factor [Nocardioides agariphilus]
MRDANAYDDFYRSTSPRLLRYCYALTGELGEAQDVAQETYLRAWRHWREVSAHPAPEAWLRLTASRLATDRWRRLAGLRRAVTRTGQPAPADPPSEDVVALTAALRQIPADQRRALAMHYLLDLPVSEIALELEVPVGTVKSWLSRGRTALAAQLAGPDDSAEVRGA